MLSERLYIDGTDIFAKFGVYVRKGGWNELVAFPPLKDFDKNDWQEEDGIEADLSAPKLDAREVNITFAASGLWSNVPAFVDLLSDGAYHVFNCVSIGRTFKLRLVQQTEQNYHLVLNLFTLRFADDFSPLEDYTYQTPTGDLPNTGFTVDGTDFAKYGVRILNGTMGDILKTASVKPNLKRSATTIDGLQYDDKKVTFQAKDVTLSCLIRAESLSSLWRNWFSLLYSLIQPEERKLGVDSIEMEFPFCYKSCSVSEFFPTDGIWLKFSLVITFLHDFRIDANGDIVLASESNEVVNTETNDNAIDLEQ